jgi:V/A-type H+-transporting ATPase subunit G/H
LAKGKTATHVDVPPASSPSGVETIVAALTQLENDIDVMYAHAEEMKKRIMAHSNEEVERLKQQITDLANEEATKIVDSAKAEADAESEKIGELGRASIAGIKKNIKSSFDRAVDNIVRTVLGETITTTTTPSAASSKEAKSTATTQQQQPPKIKRYTSDGKPVMV